VNPARSNACTKRSPRTEGTDGISYVDGERQFVRNAELLDQADEGFPKVGDGGLFGLPLAIRAHCRAQLGIGAPHSVFVLLNGVRHMDGPGHRACLQGPD
jgi:hypothetical protein